LSDPFPRVFDATFFDMPPAEAQALDPQQRLLLEVGWRALEAAGVPIDLSVAQPIGVFVAISTTDYHGATLWQPSLHGINPVEADGRRLRAGGWLWQESTSGVAYQAGETGALVFTVWPSAVPDGFAEAFSRIEQATATIYACISDDFVWLM
jgi:hypothetical protein